MKSYWKMAIAATVAAVMAAAPSTLIAAQGKGAISGHARDEAKRPYPQFSVRAREVSEGTIAGTAALDGQGRFTLADLDTVLTYNIELLNKDGNIVCTEGPFDLSEQLIKNDVVIDCNKVPLAWWLLGAAGLAGITAGFVDEPVSTTVFTPQ